MTKTSKKWRVKKNNKNKRVNKIHNSILGLITGVMAVFFLLSISSADNLNITVISMFVVSTIWISIFTYANNFEYLEEGEEG